MNFFFSISAEGINSNLIIPKFKNNGELNKSYNVFSAKIESEKWIIEKPDIETNDYYFKIKQDFLDNEKIFFLAKDNEISLIKQKKNKELFSVNNYTDTEPAYRANLELYNNLGGFSSYQSEYPSSMIKVNSSVLTSLGSLTNFFAEKNILIFRNIYFKPVKKQFDLIIFDIYDYKILDRFSIYTNKTNIINLDSKYLKENIYLISLDYVGVPIFLSEKKGHLSFEHTHPPYHYIIGKNNFKIANQLKKNIYENIKKNNTI